MKIIYFSLIKNCSCCKSFGLVALKMTWRACVRATSGCPICVSANTCPNNNSITSREDSPRSCGKRDNRHHKADSVLYFDKAVQLWFFLVQIVFCDYFGCAGIQQGQCATEGLLCIVAAEVSQSGVGVLNQAAQLSAQAVSVVGVRLLLLSRKHHTMSRTFNDH